MLQVPDPSPACETPAMPVPSVRPDPDPLLRIEGLHKSFGKTVALRGVSVALQEGSILALLGPSGCGKTTVLMTIAGFETPDRGRIMIGGHDVSGLPPHRRNIGIVFQSYALFPHLSVGDNIAFPLRRRGIRKPELGRRVRRALSLVRLEGLEDRMPNALSGGQKQRVALARALVFDPSILLLDEPLSALDKNLREEMQNELRGIQKSTGATVVFVTHDQSEALSLADQIAVMRSGSIEQLGTPDEVYYRPETAFVGRFLGEAAILRAQARAGRVHVNGTPIEMPAGRSIDFRDQELEILVRPEHMVVCPPASGGFVHGSVETVSFTGALNKTAIRLTSGELVSVVGVGRSTRAAVGTPVGLRWAPEAMRLFDTLGDAVRCH